MVIYTAGKYTEKVYSKNQPELISINVSYAKAYGIEIARLGHTPIVPQLLYQDDWNLGYERYMEMDFEILTKVDACFMLPNWQDSSGAKREEAFCRENGIKLFYSFSELVEYTIKNK